MFTTFIAVPEGSKEIDLLPLSAVALLGYPNKTFRHKKMQDLMH